MITLEASQTLRGKASVASKVTVTVAGMELSGTTETYKILAQTQPGTSVATIYTATAVTAFIRSIHVVNTDVSARTFKLYIGGTADANAITPDVSIPAGGWAAYESDSWRIYDSNGAVQTTLNTGTPGAHHTTHETGGSDVVTIDHDTLTGVSANDHHNEDHTIANTSGLGAHHTTSGLTAGQVLRASGATTALFTQLAHADLSGIGSNDHHNAVTIGADGEHSLSTQVLSGVDASSSQKGHASFDATKFSVSSGAVNLASGGHGATEHADITRSILLSASHQAGNAGDGGSLTVIGTAFPQKVPVWALADAATQGFVEIFQMPSDAVAASAITATIYWSPGSSDGTAHTVRWSFEVVVVPFGSSTVDVTGTTTTFTGSSAVRTAKQGVIESAQTVLSSTSAGDIIRLNLRRIGADAADTYVGVVNVIGIKIEYTANQ